MTSTELDSETLASKIDWYEKQLSVHCNKRSRDELSNAVEDAIADVRVDYGELLNSDYCSSIGLAPPELSTTYSDIEALHLALVTTEYYPNTEKVKGKFPPEAFYAALSLRKLEQARQYLSKQNHPKVIALLTEVKQFRGVLAGELFVRPGGKYDDKLESDTKSEHISRVRSRAVKKSKTYEENMDRQHVIIQHYETIKKILLEDSPAQFTDDELVGITIQSISEATGHRKARKSLQALPSEDRRYLSMLSEHLVESSEQGLDEAYIRRCLKNYLNNRD